MGGVVELTTGLEVNPGTNRFEACGSIRLKGSRGSPFVLGVAFARDAAFRRKEITPKPRPRGKKSWTNQLNEARWQSELSGRAERRKKTPELSSQEKAEHLVADMGTSGRSSTREETPGEKRTYEESKRGLLLRGGGGNVRTWEKEAIQDHGLSLACFTAEWRAMA